MTPQFHILVYGYGNPGRQDDGLGIALVKKLEEWARQEKLGGIGFDSNYQLNIEDAEVISLNDHVVFADASTEEIDDFILTEVTGEKDVSFTTHAASPAYIVKLCSELFGKHPKVDLIHIKGYEWDFKEGLSENAAKNLDRSFDFMKDYILNLFSSNTRPTQNSKYKIKT